MKKYKNRITGEICTVYSWNIEKKKLISNNPEMFVELFEE